MTMNEKIESLTEEQIAQFSTISDEAGLNEFLESNSIELDDEQKTLLFEYLKTGKLELTDEELDTVAGGGIGIVFSIISKIIKVAQGYEKMAKAEGRRHRVELFNKAMQMIAASDIVGFPCLRCKKLGSTYARTIQLKSVTANYYDCKCYACNHLSPEIILK